LAFDFLIEQRWNPVTENSVGSADLRHHRHVLHPRCWLQCRSAADRGLPDRALPALGSAADSGIAIELLRELPRHHLRHLGCRVFAARFLAGHLADAFFLIAVFGNRAGAVVAVRRAALRKSAC